MIILAIETSCDETAISIVKFPRLESHKFQTGQSGPKKRPLIHVLSNIVSSQIKLHAKYGGVVPNLAKREHQKNLVPILLRSLREADIIKQSKIQNINNKQNLKIKIQTIQKILEREQELLHEFIKKIMPIGTPKIDTVAVTVGPGLAPALWVGVNFAKAIAYLWNKPIIPVNHMEGHLFSAILKKSKEKNFQFSISNFQFPVLALLVSGGHTELVLMKRYGKYKIIGETLDDAAGEAFDKTARILGLKYPGGPEISRLAQKGDSNKYKLPSPMINTKDYNFSFSGLKTAVFYLTRNLLGDAVTNLVTASPSASRIRMDIAASFEKAVVDVLIKKTIRAAEEFRAKTILLGGGVAANEKLRQELTQAVKKHLPNSKLYIPDPDLTGDNALMIACAASFTRKRASHKIEAQPNLKILS